MVVGSTAVAGMRGLRGNEEIRSGTGRMYWRH